MKDNLAVMAAFGMVLLLLLSKLIIISPSMVSSMVHMNSKNPVLLVQTMLQNSDWMKSKLISTSMLEVSVSLLLTLIPAQQVTLFSTLSRLTSPTASTTQLAPLVVMVLVSVLSAKIQQVFTPTAVHTVEQVRNIQCW